MRLWLCKEVPVLDPKNWALFTQQVLDETGGEVFATQSTDLFFNGGYRIYLILVDGKLAGYHTYENRKE